MWREVRFDLWEPWEVKYTMTINTPGLMHKYTLFWNQTLYSDTKSDISYLVEGAHPFADTLKLQKVEVKVSLCAMSTWWPQKKRKNFCKLITPANYVIEQHSIYEKCPVLFLE